MVLCKFSHALSYGTPALLSLSAHNFLILLVLAENSVSTEVLRPCPQFKTIILALWILVQSVKCVFQLDSISHHWFLLKLLLFLSYSSCWKKIWRLSRSQTFHKHLLYESFMTLLHCLLSWIVNAKTVSPDSDSQECNMQSTQKEFNTLAAN